MPKKNKGLKPGTSLPTSARQAQIMVQMSIMAKAKHALEKLRISIYEIDLIPTDLRSTDGRTYRSVAAHILFADGRKKDRWGSIHEEKKTVYID